MFDFWHNPTRKLLLSVSIRCVTLSQCLFLLSMGTKKRKPQPLVAPVKSMKRARFLTSSFHKLTHQVAICASPSLTGRIQPREWLVQAEEAAASGDAIKAQKLDQQVSELGGRAAYQAASELTTSKHRVSKWVFSVLTELGLRPSKGQPPLPLLEVRSGAVLQTAESAKWAVSCLNLGLGCLGGAWGAHCPPPTVLCLPAAQKCCMHFSSDKRHSVCVCVSCLIQEAVSWG